MADKEKDQSCVLAADESDALSIEDLLREAQETAKHAMPASTMRRRGSFPFATAHSRAASLMPFSSSAYRQLVQTSPEYGGTRNAPTAFTSPGCL